MSNLFDNNEGTNKDLGVYPDCGMSFNDRYRLLEIIGTGGMGRVYKALDEKAAEVNKKEVFVAIKVLLPQLIHDKRAIKSLKKEAIKAQQLTHEHIISVYGFDSHSDWTYINMEWLDGHSLNDVLAEDGAENGLPLETVKEYFAEMSNALTYAHKQGVIHRDIDPKNIFVTPNRGIVLIDFGLSYDARQSLSRGRSNSFTGKTSGKPIYMSPESLVAGHIPTVQDDIYSLAVTIYELLTGYVPFIEDVCYKRDAKTSMPRKPNKLNQKQWNVLQSALDFTPKKRPATVDSFYQQFVEPENPRSPIGLKSVILGLLVCVGIGAGGYVWYENGQGSKTEAELKTKQKQDNDEEKYQKSEVERKIEVEQRYRNLADKTQGIGVINPLTLSPWVNTVSQKVVNYTADKQNAKAKREATVLIDGYMLIGSTTVSAAELGIVQNKPRQLQKTNDVMPPLKLVLEDSIDYSSQLSKDNIVAKVVSTVKKSPTTSYDFNDIDDSMLSYLQLSNIFYTDGGVEEKFNITAVDTDEVKYDGLTYSSHFKQADLDGVFSKSTSKLSSGKLIIQDYSKEPILILEPFTTTSTLDGKGNVQMKTSAIDIKTQPASAYLNIYADSVEYQGNNLTWDNDLNAIWGKHNFTFNKLKYDQDPFPTVTFGKLNAKISTHRNGKFFNLEIALNTKPVTDIVEKFGRISGLSIDNVNAQCKVQNIPIDFLLSVLQNPISDNTIVTCDANIVTALGDADVVVNMKLKNSTFNNTGTIDVTVGKAIIEQSGLKNMLLSKGYITEEKENYISHIEFAKGDITSVNNKLQKDEETAIELESVKGAVVVDTVGHQQYVQNSQQSNATIRTNSNQTFDDMKNICRELNTALSSYDQKVNCYGKLIYYDFFGDTSFEYKSSKLNQQTREALDAMMVVFKRHGSKIRVFIKGHTDNIGSEKYNLKLSAERAKAVGNYLASLGFPYDQMIVTGVGEGEPVASNNTEKGRRMNRRVGILIKPLEKGKTNISKKLTDEQLRKVTDTYRGDANRKDDFIPQGNGTVIDKRTGLQWMQCSIGQQWTGKTCEGNSTEYSFDETIKKRQVFAGYNDWRLPLVEELETLVYCSSGKFFARKHEENPLMCKGKYQVPTIFHSVFPNTLASSFYWTSTPMPKDEEEYWGHKGAIGINFRQGYNYEYSDDSYYRYIRLVRDVQ